MSKARIFAILAFIALGAAWGSLIVGDATWFAWSAGTGALALIIWARTTREAADADTGPWFEQIHPSPMVRFTNHRPARVCATTTHAPPRCRSLIEGGHEPLWRNSIRRDDHRPVWPTDIFGAPE